MRPKEFISRCIDLIDFSKEGFIPDSLNSAALSLSVMGDDEKRLEVNGYRIDVNATNCLGHIVMIAEIFEDCTFIVGASLCFTFQDYDFDIGGMETDSEPDEDHIYESWRMGDRNSRAMNRVMDALTFLTLKTNYRIQNKVST